MSTIFQKSCIIQIPNVFEISIPFKLSNFLCFVILYVCIAKINKKYVVRNAGCTCSRNTLKLAQFSFKRIN